MVEKSIPFTGKTVGDAGPYSADEWARIWRTLFSGILRNNASVIVNTGNGVDDALYVEQTSPASTQIQVNIGAALVKGYWYESDAIETLQIPPNGDASGDDRIDLCILRLDLVNQQIRLAILEGTVAAVPAPPALTQNATIWEVQIAEIFVDNGVGIGTNVLDADIDNTVRDYAHLWHWKQGGTSKGLYNVREILIGQSDGSLDVAILTGFAVGRTTQGALKTGAAWGTLECAEVNDPDGLISVASNVITFAKKGVYALVDFFAQVNTSAGASQYMFRLRQTSGTPATLLSSTGETANTTIRNDYGLPGVFTIAADNTTVELQMWPDDATMQLSTPIGFTNAPGETVYNMKAVFVRLGNA